MFNIPVYGTKFCIEKETNQSTIYTVSHLLVLYLGAFQFAIICIALLTIHIVSKQLYKKYTSTLLQYLE